MTTPAAVLGECEPTAGDPTVATWDEVTEPSPVPAPGALVWCDEFELALKSEGEDHVILPPTVPTTVRPPSAPEPCVTRQEASKGPLPPANRDARVSKKARLGA